MATFAIANNDTAGLIARLGSHRFLQHKRIRELTFADSVVGPCVFAQDNKGAILWDVTSGKRLRVFDQSNYVSGAMSRDGRRIVLSEDDSQVRVFDVKTSKFVFTSKLRGQSHCVAISDDGTLVALLESEASQLTVWKIPDEPTGEMKRVHQWKHQWKRDADTVGSLKFSQDSKRLLCAGSTGKKTLVYSLDKDEAPIHSQRPTICHREKT